MTIFRELSVIWSLVHVLILFMFLYESRYPKKKAMTLTIIVMVPLAIFNLACFFILGPEKCGEIVLLTCTLPSLIFFWFLAKYRDGRFLFTFCVVDTISLEIIYITYILDYYLPGDNFIFMFLSRLIAFPLLEWFVAKKFRAAFLEIQKHTKKGWYAFAAIGGVFYVVLVLVMSFPTIITDRPEYLPLAILLFVLMPVLYINIFITLKHQAELHFANEQENILKLQISNMRERIAEINLSEEAFRIERHNFRHKIDSIATMIESKQYDEVIEYLQKYHKTLDEIKVKRYTTNAVIDSILASYLQKAESNQIKITTSIKLPDTLPVDEVGLSVVFANAIENAINACMKLSPEDRYIEIQAITYPCFMIQISNSFDGNISLDKNGVPVSTKSEHGLGTRSIVAFCEKAGAAYEFKTNDRKFSLRIVIE